MKTGNKRSLTLLAAVVAAILLTASQVAQASGSGIVTAASSGTASGSTTVTLKIPGVIGIDVESDVTFDLTSLSAAAAPDACQNVFPAGSSCSSATYTPTSVSTTSGASPTPEFVAPTASAGKGAIYLSLMDSTAGTVSTKKVTNVVPASWSGTDPGIATTDLQTQKAGTNNGGLGNSSFAALPTSAANMGGISSIPQAAFNWAREDQDFRLVIPSSENPSATGNATVVVTFAFSRS
jgi:hypothetical protein